MSDEERDLDLTPVRSRRRQQRVTTVQRVRKLERENKELRAAVESHAQILRSVAEVLGGMAAVADLIAVAVDAAELNDAGRALRGVIVDHFPPEEFHQARRASSLAGGRPVLMMRAEPEPINDPLGDQGVQGVPEPEIDEPETDDEQDDRSSRSRQQGGRTRRRSRQGPSRRGRPLLGS